MSEDVKMKPTQDLIIASLLSARRIKMTPAEIKMLSVFMQETAKRLEEIIDLLNDSKMEMEDFAPWFEDSEAKKKRLYMHECTEAVDTFEGWQDCTEGRAQNLIDDGSLWEVVKNEKGEWVEV